MHKLNSFLQNDINFLILPSIESAIKRINQPTVGPNYGMHFPLRPGVEVLITFIDGDPDRPLIVGAVPNPLTPSPVTSSDSTKNRIRTQSGVLFEIEDGTGS